MDVGENGKVTDSDYIPLVIARVAATWSEEALLEIANNIIPESEFPLEWKEARLVLIEKSRKALTVQSTYLPYKHNRQNM